MELETESNNHDGFIDRSKVRILLCDNDSKSSQEVFTLLMGCSYQVTSVKSVRQVIDALNAEEQHIDIILAEVDLPIKMGMKMLKYIARDNELRRIPVIMMSAQDEVSVVVKCLRLGAADYLLGLVENNILNYDFDLVASDPSDANKTSTTLFSDDTDDKSKRSTNPEAGISIQQVQEASIAVAVDDVEEIPDAHVSEYQPGVPGISDRRTVTSVKSVRQVIDALNAEEQHIDIILAEVDLPIKMGMKMLKYIARDNELRRIPVIMMSAQDEVSVVVKCLRLGAADYLVKPLRTNELLNLWTHMWRRRRMLGLVENNILNYDFDLVASDPSDANKTSTTLFSDDTDDKSKRSTNPEAGISIQQVQEASIAVAVDDVEEIPDAHVSEYQPGVPGISDRRTGHFSSGPKKSELRIGESSAFFTYVKAKMLKNNFEEIVHADNNATTQVEMEGMIMNQTCAQQGGNDLLRHENGETFQSHSQNDIPSSNNVPDSFSIERSCTPPASVEVSQQKHYKDEHGQGVVYRRNGSHGSDLKTSGITDQHAHPYYIPGVVNHVMMPSTAQLYQKNIQGLVTSPFVAHLRFLHSWPSLGNSSSSEVNLSKVDRREAALMKFRQKRKERCFDKKIRYVNRKRLAERRPRVKGQFVRKLNGVNVDLNGQPVDDEEEEDNHMARDFSPNEA
ncbi:hypothetical protein TanjilG_26326 [Lupinus angustifolius]|uniref:Two-component response regulator-like APRR1 n=2 Tax=rosids TaxID=71275 RepID=A0A4P1R3E2_LUPAN|nr:hypothetical protein TanjilG_26326 [Lupinus angustifolius]